LNIDLERGGTIKVAAEFKVVDGRPKSKNRYHVNLDKYHQGATKKGFLRLYLGRGKVFVLLEAKRI
jgi:hypothetical protein